MSRILITGISGQDGSYLAEKMLDLGHEVFGIIRRHSVSENQQSRIDHVRDKITTFYGDMSDASSLERVLAEVQPDYIFNLAAQSHVRVSFDMPVYTSEVDAIGTLKLLEAYKRICPKARLYQASSSEMFGITVDEDGFQREETTLNPASPYGVAKVFSYNIARHYRRAYGLYICNGILFNHESSRRGANFVTQKVVTGAVRIKLGLQDKLVLGNLDSKRDWGHAKDYVDAMWMMMNHVRADDFVIATGKAHSVRDMCETVFSYLGLDYRDYVKQNSKYMRPEEVSYLRGDATRANIILGWQPRYTFEELMTEMVNYQLQKHDYE